MRTSTAALAGIVLLCGMTELWAQARSTPRGHPNLTVHNGSGSNAMNRPRDVLPVTAEIPEGFAFVKWFEIEGNGELDSAFDASTTYTIGNEDAVLVATFAKIESWFPPGPEENTQGLLLPKPATGQPARLEQRVRATVSRGQAARPPCSDIWSAVKVKSKWEEADSVKFFREEAGNQEIPNDSELPNAEDFFEPKSEGIYEAKMWYEGNLTQEEIAQMAENGNAAKVTINLNLKIHGADLPSSWEGTLLPIEMKRLWSDQLTGVEANFLPYVMPNQPASGLGTGNRDTTYIFMGAAQSNNFDFKGHLKAAVSVPGPPELRSKVLWRLAKKSGNSYTPENGSSFYESEGETVKIALDNPSSDKSHYVLVVGYDQDGSGQLSASEVNLIPEYRWQGVDWDYEIKLVSKSRYDTGVSTLNATATRWTIPFPQAKHCLRAFLDESTPQGASPESTTINRLEYGLDHPVGVRFDANSSSREGLPNAGPGHSITAVFGPQSTMSREVADGTTVNNWLHGKLDEKASVVRDYFNSHPDENYANFNFHFDTKNAKGEEVGLSFLPDMDLFLALGKGTISANIQVEVNRGLIVERLVVTANVLDLYDFDYDFEVYGWAPDEAKSAADVQAGYRTLGESGRVFKGRIEIRDYEISGEDLSYQFP